MSEDRKEAFRTGIAQIPDDLINLHRIEGGVCGLLIGYCPQEVVRATLTPRDSTWYDDKRIEMAVSPKWSNGEIPATVAHEFGNFLYFQTYMF